MANPLYEKRQLSASTSGTPISITATATAGTTVHTSVAGFTAEDEIYLYATNSHSSAVLLTIEFSGAAVKNNIIFSVPADDGLYLMLPGLILNGAVVVKAFAATTAVINVSGYVHRITD